MADPRVSSDNTNLEISALKESLRAQQEIMLRLQLELEIERESAATAASEALSMILRLQGEKAAEEMEARQYKRMTEEKLNHVEESLALYEELMHLKEMQISSLELQLQACQNKLSSVGYYDFGIVQKNNLEASSCFSTRTHLDLTNLSSIGRRASLPPMRFKHPKLEVIPSRKDNLSLLEREWDVDVEAFCDIGSKPADKMFIRAETSLSENSCNQKKEMEKNDKSIRSHLQEKPRNELHDHFSTNNIDVNVSTVLCSMTSKSRPEEDVICVFPSSQAGNSNTSLDQDLHTSSEVGYTCFPSGVHDVHEIPQNEREIMHDPHLDKDKASFNPGEMPQHSNMYYRTDAQSIKSVFVLDAEDEITKYTETQSPAANSSTDNVDSKLDSPALTQCDYLMIDQRLRRLENERTDKEMQDLEGRKREIKLLSDISDQLRSIQMHIKGLKPGKQSLPAEYMDYFTQVDEKEDGSYQ